MRDFLLKCLLLILILILTSLYWTQTGCMHEIGLIGYLLIGFFVKV